MTNEELDKLMEELLHFQRKLDKMKWLQDEHKTDAVHDDIPEHRTGDVKQKVVCFKCVCILQVYKL
jgi:hypothetical protein